MAILPANINLEKRFPQADKRHVEWFEDDHGRNWTAAVDEKGEPVEPLQPTDWTAPIAPDWARHLLLPPGHLVTLRRERGRAPRVVVNTDRWLGEMERSMADYKKHAREIVKRLSGGTNVQQYLRDPTPEMIEEIGVGPFPGLAFVQAIADGDAWALGLSADVPAWAQALLPGLLETARAGKLLSMDAMRSVATEERRAAIREAERSVAVGDAHRALVRDQMRAIADEGEPAKAQASVKWSEFLRYWSAQGKRAADVSAMWQEYKASGAHSPLVAGAA